ncbi:molybdenum cofactor biosynthesis protein MoaE [Thermodesulfobacteriota bacterium]
MDLNKMIQSIKEEPNFDKVGMVASHLGIVRGNSLKGGEVIGVDVVFNKISIDKIINDIQNMKGIFKVLVYTVSGTLKVGDEIMAVVVSGDVRENVFPSLVKAVDRIKKEAVEKKEIFKN